MRTFCFARATNLPLLFLVIVMVCTLKDEGKENNTLQLLHILFRHGNRSPDTESTYPNDPYINHTYYPYGHGQLTNKGKINMYLLGKALRKRYDQFLGPLYTPDILDSVSTNYNRTKMSLQLVLAGLFPPRETPLEWQTQLNWQPIPYNYETASSDSLFAYPLLLCSKYISLLRLLDSSPKGLAFHGTYSELYKYFKKHSGVDSVSVVNVAVIYTSLAAQDDYGLKLPFWTKYIYPKQLKCYMGDLLDYTTSTNELKQLSGGFLLKKIIQDTNAKIDNKLKPKDRKLFLYSAHDFTVAYTLSVMNVYYPHVPPYGAYVAIEVHKLNNVYGIKIFYQDYKSEEPNLLKVPGCDSFCPLHEFERLLKNNLPTKTNQCKDDSSTHQLKDSKFIWI